MRAEGEEILTNTVVIHFFPNSWDPFNTVNRMINGKSVEERYDPNVENVLEEIAQLAGQFGAARIIIEGHTDSSMKGQVPVACQGPVAEAGQRHQGSPAQEVSPILMPIDSTSTAWAGTARPIDPLNQTKNRRVEIKVLTAEKAN